MTNLYLAPVNEDWMRRFEQTVKTPISLDDYDLPAEFEDVGETRIWGTTRAKDSPSDHKDKYFDAMEAGDVVLFYKGGEYFGICRVIDTYQSQEAGKEIWDNSESEYIYTVHEYTEVSIDDEIVIDMLGFQDNFNPNGFMKISDTRIPNLLQQYDSVDAAYQELREKYSTETGGEGETKKEVERQGLDGRYSSFTDEATYYWVNQTRDVEVEEEFLRAPVDNVSHHDLSILDKGDTVFHYKEQRLIGYSEVESNVRIENHDGDEYYFVDVDFNEYDEKPSIDQVNEYLSEDEVKLDTYYPLNRSGGVNQGYLFRLSRQGGEWLLSEGWKSGVDWREKLKKIPESVEIEPTDLHFPEREEEILGQVSKALENGDHVLLVGPPGTGKSKLAKAICDSVVDDGYEFVTATSDWSTFDTVGGYHPEKNESLVFKPGVFLDRFKNEQGNPQNEWLVIDEINRADIDKAFGALFSVLAGDDVTLSFTDEGGRNIRVVCNGDPEQGTPDNVYYVPDDWRMVATMNTLDKTSLYEMSYAFMRRWAFVSVPVPDIPDEDEGQEKLIGEYVNIWTDDGEDGDEDKYTEIAELWRVINRYREIGPAIVEDIYEHVENDPSPDYASAISMYVIPQLEGLRENELRDFVTDLKEAEVDVDTDRVKDFVEDYFQVDV